MDAQVLATPTVAVTVYSGNASGNGIGGAPPAGEPSWVPAPPPPPPPPPPLVITSATGSVSDNFIIVQFDREAGSNSPPNWSVTGGLTVTALSWNDATEVVVSLSDALVGGEQLTVDAGPTQIFARNNGGVVAPGTYPIAGV